MRLRKIRILLQNFSINSSRRGPLLLTAEKFTHDEACFQATVGLEGTVKFPGGFLELLVLHKLSGNRKMLEQFRGRFLLGASGRDTGFCLAQRSQSMGISAGGG